jgi:DNA-binding HxlR family transcriptional regulator
MVRGRCYASSAELSVQLLQGKWKASILSFLGARPAMRYGEIRRALPGLTDKMLTQRLRDLEATGLVERTILPRSQVAYALTDRGQSLTPIVRSLQAWGAEAGRAIDARFIAS